MDLILVRFLFVIVVSVTCYFIEPFGQPRNVDAAVGAAVGAAIIAFEWNLRRVSLKRLIGAAFGSILGICGAYLFALVIRSSIAEGPTRNFLQILVMLLMAYVGLIVGANKGDLLNLAALGGIFGGEKQSKKSYKILDTSVIIDGRIADIAETGFLDGTIVTPQFVLRELQFAQYELRSDDDAVEKAGFGDVGNAAVDDHAGVEDLVAFLALLLAPKDTA